VLRILHVVNSSGLLMRPGVAHGTNLWALGRHEKQKGSGTPRFSCKSACFLKRRSIVAPHEIGRLLGSSEAAAPSEMPHCTMSLAASVPQARPGC